eukprot:m.86084 g.86084  ORF g.86084 m.86084 type:complete len:466 (+) comp13534_c0_seq3:28-1425(+)
MASQIPTLMGLTGATHEQAKQFLEMAGGDIDQAANLYFEHGSHGQEAQAKLNGDPPPFEDEVRKPIKPKTERLVGDPVYPAGFVAYQTRLRNAEARFHEDLGDLFKIPRGLVFNGTFTEAKARASQLSHWLLVSVHDPADFACQALIRDVLRDEAVVELIRNHFVFSQVQRSTPGAFDYESYYTIPTMPHIAVLNPFTGEQVYVFKPHEVATAESFTCAVVTFVEKFATPTAGYGTFFTEEDDEDDVQWHARASSPRPPRKQVENPLKRKHSVEEIPAPRRYASTRSAPEQIAAPARARPALPLRRAQTDRERARAGGGAGAAGPATPPPSRSWQAQRLSESDDDDEDDVAVISPPKKFAVASAATAAASPPPPPRECPAEPPATDKTACTIRFHLPDSKKVVRRFRPSSPVQDVFLFAASQGFAAPRYDLIIQFPKTSLSAVPSHSSLADLKIGNTNIHVQEND